jgi:magnesium chelatase subunit D
LNDRSPPAVERRHSAHLPFSAVVGQDDAKTALLLAALEPRLGGVLLRGDKGSGKTTLARGLAALLDGAPFVELPLGATEDRVVGSIDIAALLGDRTHAFRPGLLAGADGGVLYVDEINLLADHLVDTLLDVAVSGVNRVERDGISEAHPARFVLVGSMNPEEGELRPQLLDRFGLTVEVRAPSEARARAEIVRRQMAFDEGGMQNDAMDADGALRAALRRAVPARLGPGTVEAAVRLALAVGAEGLRADLALCRAAGALAGWEGRAETGPDDLRRVAPMVLAHRRRRHPFDAPGLGDQELADALDEALGPPRPPPSGDDTGPEEAPISRGKAPPNDTNADAEAGPGDGDDSDLDGGVGTAGGPVGAPPEEGSMTGGSADPGVDLSLGLGLPELDRRPSAAGRVIPGRGRRSAATTGRAVGDSALERSDQRLAVAATAVTHATRTAGSPGELVVSDLRAVVGEQSRATLVILAVDTSGSMAARDRLATARAAVLGLLGDAYRRRDRVALIVFRDTTAEVVLRPTASIEIARSRLHDLPTGGTTPLAAGIQAITHMVRNATRTGGPDPVAVLITDGRATAGGDDPVAEAHQAAAELARTGTPCLVLDAETGRNRLGLAKTLADRLGAEHVELAGLEGQREGAVEQAIRDRVAAINRPS